MTGIVSYGGYIPMRRLNRKIVAKNMSWFSPGLAGLAKGERSMANWDEDCLTMAVAAGRDALVGMDKSILNGIFLASTTFPFMDRDNAGVVKTALNLKDDVISADFASSQKAGVNALMTGLDAAKGGDKHNILVVASDKRNAQAGSNQEMLLGHGAGAFVVGNDNVIAEYLGGYAIALDFVDHYRGEGAKFDVNWEERWYRDEGLSKLYPEVFKGAMEKAGVGVEEITKFVYPCIYGAFHPKMALKVGAQAEQLAGTLQAEVGECGTAHPFIMLAKELETARPGDVLLVAGVGQGATAMIFRVTDQIGKLAQRTGVSGYLAKKRVEESYTKWLQYSELIATDIGTRGDTDMRTGLSPLYRNRKYILGYEGVRCKSCGTPQIPPNRICVNPSCQAVNTMEPYEFASRPAKILSFTADNLAASLDPPAMSGMIEFEGGGRALADFTDCVLDDIEVGVPVEMTFRVKHYDAQRKFTAYFWKATPCK